MMDPLIIKELEQIFQKLQEEQKIPQKIIGNEKASIIKSLAEDLVKMNPNPMEFLKDEKNHQKLSIVFLAKLAQKRGHEIDTDAIALLLMPKDKLAQDPKSQEKLRKALKKLLTQLNDAGLIKVKDMDDTINKLMDLKSQDLENVTTLLLRATNTALYGFDPSGMSLVAPIATPVMDSVGIVLTNIFPGEKNILRTVEEKEPGGTSKPETKARTPFDGMYKGPTAQ